MSYILSIDQGTTGTTALILNAKLEIIAKQSQEFAQHFPQPGWVEHNLEDIWQSTQDVITKALHQSGIVAKELKGIGITNQRETVGLWNQQGKPLHNAIVWQCRRTADFCQTLKDQGHEKAIYEKTGLVIDAYFSASKIHWLLNHLRPSLDQLHCGTIDSYLVYRLTQGQSFVTDVTNASRTQLMNIHTLQWDPDLLALFEVPKQILPRIVSCAEVVGHTQGLSFLPDGIPICGMAGDQQAALFGQICFEKNQAKCTFGTGAFLLVNTGEKPVFSKHRLLTTVACQIKDQTTYALEGSVFIAGSLIQWLRDGLGLIKNSEDIEKLALTTEQTDGVYVVAALSGLGAPYWDAQAKGIISGIHRGTHQGHIARASLEGIAYLVHDLIHAFEEDLGQTLTQLKVDGGASLNDTLMQFQADILKMTLIRPSIIETTALGACFLAGLTVGQWKDTHEISQAWKENKNFSPSMDDSLRSQKLQGWKKALAQARF